MVILVLYCSYVRHGQGQYTESPTPRTVAYPPLLYSTRVQCAIFLCMTLRIVPVGTGDWRWEEEGVVEG